MQDELLFGEWVRRRRKALDLTQEALADCAGCSLSAIRKIERDERRPSRQVAELLAACLRVAESERPQFLKAARTSLFLDEQALPAPLTPPPPPSPVAVAETKQSVSAPAQQSPLPAPPTSLPAPPTPLIGRTAELMQMAALLANPTCRLLTVVGVGGVGKTRLAIQAAHEYLADHRQLVCFVPLAPVNAPEYVPTSLATALGLRRQPQLSAERQIVDYLCDQQALIVLDNLEHLLAARREEVAVLADWLNELLDQAPGLKLLVTSREQLNLPGEWVFDLQGLPLPAQGTGDHSSAVLLFVAMARRTHTGFQPTAKDMAAIQRICHLVAGLPLALELAASWVRMLSCQEIAAEIERGIDFLSTTGRGLAGRHRSITAVFDHSWGLLSAEEQQALRRLALFRGGFTREAALEVAGASLVLLSALVAKSLLRRAEQVRFDLHELVRQYADGRLSLAQETTLVHDRHLTYYARLASAAGAHLYGAEQATWLERVESELGNLRAALAWAFQPPIEENAVRATRGLQAVVDLHRFWHGRGYLDEGCRWLERGLSVLPASAQRERGYACNVLGWLLYQQGELQRARSLQQQSLAIFRTLDDPVGMADALDVLGDIAWGAGEFAEACGYYEEGLAIQRRLQNPTGIGLALYSLGRLHVDYGNPQSAKPLLNEALLLLRRAGDRRGVALALHATGRAAFKQADATSAEALIGESLKLFGELGNKIDIAECLEELALLAHMGGEWPRAATLLGAAQALRRLTGVERSLDADQLAQLAQAIAAAALTEHWQAGQSLDAATAVAMALRQTVIPCLKPAG